MPAQPPPLLIPSGLFTCPRCGTTASIPAAQLVAGYGNLTSAAGFCNRCEHGYQLTGGAPSTTTTGAANTQGAVALTVASGTSFSTAGALLIIDSGDVDGGTEIVKTSGAGSSTSIPIAATPLLLAAHAAGATVQTATLAPLGPMT